MLTFEQRVFQGVGLCSTAIPVLICLTRRSDQEGIIIFSAFLVAAIEIALFPS